MARKLDVAIGLMHRPAVLFLDEPTVGLDPQSRAEMWEEIERLAREEKTTVGITTHYLDEADRLADRLAIIDHGRLVVEGSPEDWGIVAGRLGLLAVVAVALAFFAVSAFRAYQRSI
jgi:ABC-2 type transport system ATP-binding protein